MTPTVFFVIGPAGSGKSTVSRQLARRYDAAYLDKDTVATAFTELLLEQNGSDRNDRDHNEYYLSTILPLEYATLLRLCADNLGVGRSVVLDAPFGRFFADGDYLLEATADWPDASLVVVHVTAAGPLVQDRVARRGYARDTWKLAHWDQFWATTQATTCNWSGATHLTLDNSSDTLDLDGFDTALRAAAGRVSGANGQEPAAGPGTA
ncbi:AAA family ATPase [Kribbella sp. HUAS MG21]|uniref:AAA family ATPase n=1 Tax=Kribbella sp. HUAS MG21 TaxID=3160966 RepID=A0AAU7T6C3_9ACTN